MTQKIYKDGTDQYVLARLGSINNTTGAQSILMGATEGAALSTLISDIVLVWSEYKKADESIETPSITWNSSAAMWKITIPSEKITQFGTSWLNLSGQDDSGINIIPVAIEVEEVSHMAYKKVVPPISYNFVPSIKQIILKNEYVYIGSEQILSIFNLSKQIEIYNSLNPKKHSLFIKESERTQDFDIDINNGVLTYVESAGMDDKDKIQIIVNSE